MLRSLQNLVTSLKDQNLIQNPHVGHSYALFIVGFTVNIQLYVVNFY
jgi:hypothetical protein